MPTPAPPARPPGPARYRTSLARRSEVPAAQRLRASVLAAGSAARAGTATSARDDLDEWDDLCDHLVVRDEADDEVVGTCQLLPPERTMALARSYGDDRFDLARHARLRPWTVAAGRSYVHPAHRPAAVTSRLSAGVLRYVLERGHPFLAGCACIPLTDGGSTAAGIWDVVRPRHLAPAALRVVPHLPFDVEGRGVPGQPPLPSPLRGCLRSGGVVCGRPAHDRAAGIAEFYVVVPLSAVAARALGSAGGRR
ncbi:GNAT family N-acetyltransferase [Blastococcus xanthinilyticus]|uniref:Ornithine-acyl[acyl carrier protein] N-acyltransferase n=1 Tax=Blastococcus xanthinilyticus TaxID=1564164 RepID=A0A5S5D2A0_9ACTN|nr:GNAT family N-acyltransferase [Blastococcus xanthinilyticus]TYP89544.1 ornithine-acyl[acyl carrier protein] N-acyltransferase [Blastococcus xanthinilyticus]